MLPLLLIDVDGVLNPYAMPRARRAERGFTEHFIADPDEPRRVYTVLLNPDDGARLAALADRFELVWCTTWMGHANTEIGPRIGLPRLRVLPIDRTASAWRLFWKTPQVARQSAGRPFVWLDDDIGSPDRIWLDKHVSQPHLAISVHPARGLDEAIWRRLDDFTAADQRP